MPKWSLLSPLYQNLLIEASDSLRRFLSIPTSHKIFFSNDTPENLKLFLQSNAGPCGQLVTDALTGINTSGNPGFQGSDFKPISFSDLESNPGEFTKLGITHTDILNGARWPADAIQRIRAIQPEALLIVDADYALPYTRFDFTIIDALHFNGNSGFGLPAGIRTWILGDRCLHPQDLSKSQPSPLPIYLMARVTDDLLRRGLEIIRKETDYKAVLLYRAIDTLPLLEPVAEKIRRSSTLLAAKTTYSLPDAIHHLDRAGIEVGTTPGDHLLFTNFPSHSKEQYEWLVDELATWPGR